MNTQHTLPDFLTVADLAAAIPCSQPTIYARIRAGKLPQRRYIAPSIFGWYRSDIEHLLEKNVRLPNIFWFTTGRGRAIVNHQLIKGHKVHQHQRPPKRGPWERKKMDIQNLSKTASMLSRMGFKVGDSANIPNIFPKGKKGLLKKLMKDFPQRRPLGSYPRMSMTEFLRKKAWDMLRSRNMATPAGMTPSDLNIIERADGVTLLKADYLYTYSSTVGSWPQNAAFLMGRDDGGWILRVSSSVTSIADAIEWSKPAIVRQADKKGLPTLRQGDVFLIPLRIPHHDTRALEGTRHDATIAGDTITLRHPQHETLIAQAPTKMRWRAVLAKRISRRGVRGD